MAAAEGETIKIVAEFAVDLDDELGRGTFGTVYRARNSQGQIVAAKKINIGQRNSSTAKEIANYYKLPNEHDNILKVEGIRTTVTPHAMWVFLEMCHFGDVDKFFQGNEFEKVEMSIIITKQAMSGLAYLHSRDIIHRDVKPGNILIKCFPSLEHEGAVKLTDFGLSKYLDPTGQTSAMTSDVGTAAFKAPEFYSGIIGERVVYQC